MAQVLEERVSRLEGALGQMNERLGGIETNIASLRQEMNANITGLREEMNANNASLRQEMNTAIVGLHGEIHTNFRWTMGTVLVMWVTIICTILLV